VKAVELLRIRSSVLTPLAAVVAPAGLELLVLVIQLTQVALQELRGLF
jgi:hypothetical protein